MNSLEYERRGLRVGTDPGRGRSNSKGMRLRWGRLLGCALLVSAPLGADCVPTGTSKQFDFDRPGMQPSDDANHPPVWAHPDGDPKVEEVDTISNDAMGDAKTTDTGASVEVTNSGGDLSGPNGKVQNGIGEGDCIEVRVCWTYYRYTQVWELGSLELIFEKDGGGLNFRFEPIWRWVRVETCSDPREICPEGHC